MDEIDAVRSLPFSTDEFFAAIRECYNRRTEDPEYNRLTFCLLGVAAPSDLIRNTQLTPFNIGRRIELTDFMEEEAKPLAEGLKHGDSETGRQGKNDAQVVLQRILYWTGGHPYLTQRLCHAVAEVNQKTQDGRCTTHDVDLLCENLFLSSRSRETDDNLLFVRERILRSEADLAALLNVYGQVHSGKQVKDDETNPLVSILRLSGITRVVDGCLRVRNRIYQRVFDKEWITANMPDAELRRQKAAFRRGLLRAASVAAAVVAVMLALVVIAVSKARVAQEALRQADISAGRLKLRSEQRERTLRETRQLLYLSDMNVAFHDWETLNLGRMVELLNFHRPQPGEEDLRSFEWFYLWRLCHGDLFTLKGHTLRVWSVTFSPDGKMVATGSNDKTAKLWDAETGREIRTLTGHKSSVSQVKFSPDGSTLRTISADKTIKFWDLKTGQATRTVPIETAGLNHTAELTADGNTLATRRDNNTVTLQDLTTGRIIQTINTEPFFRMTFSPDGKTLATGEGRVVMIRDVRTGQKITRLGGDERYIYSLAFSSDGRRLAAGSFDGIVQIWDVATGREIRTLTGHGGIVWAIVFSPDGKRLATVSRDRTVKIWDAATGKLMLTFKGHDREVLSVAFSPDGKRLATGSLDHMVKVWDAVRAREMPFLLRGHTGFVVCVVFSPTPLASPLSKGGNRGILATGSRDRTAKLWDVATGREMRTLTGHEDGVDTIAFTQNGKVLATGSRDKTVKLWDVATGREIRTLTGHTHVVQSVAFSPDGKTLATGSSDKTVKLWDVASGQEIWTHKDYPASILSIAFSPDGKMLATGGDGMVKLLDAPTGREIKSFQGQDPLDPFSSVALSPDGKMLAAGQWGSTITLLDMAKWKPVRTLKCSSVVNSVAFSPDGRRLVTGSGEGAVKLWDVATGREILTLTGPTLDTRVVFSPDGRRIAAGSLSNTVMLWEAASKEEVAARDAQERGKD